MNVEIRGWDKNSALASVDGVKVRVRFRAWWCRWICDECGEFDGAPGCPHTIAFSRTRPPEEQRQVKRRHRRPL